MKSLSYDESILNVRIHRWGIPEIRNILYDGDGAPHRCSKVIITSMFEFLVCNAKSYYLFTNRWGPVHLLVFIWFQNYFFSSERKICDEFSKNQWTDTETECWYLIIVLEISWHRVSYKRHINVNESLRRMKST
jgi:hypothetical protein